MPNKTARELLDQAKHTTPREHIDQAKHLLACGVYHTAQAHAMIAIAELLADMADRTHAQ